MSRIVKVERNKKVKLKKYVVNFTLADGFKAKRFLYEEMTTGLNFNDQSYGIESVNFNYFDFSKKIQKDNYAEIPSGVYCAVDHKIYEITEHHVIEMLHSNELLSCEDGVVLNLKLLSRFKYEFKQDGEYEKEVDFYSIYTKEETK